MIRTSSKVITATCKRTWSPLMIFCGPLSWYPPLFESPAADHVGRSASRAKDSKRRAGWEERVGGERGALVPLKAASSKYQLDSEMAKKKKKKKTNFFTLAQNEALWALVKSSINQKLFFYAVFSFRCPKSAKIDRKWATYSDARKLKSKNFHYKLIVRRICSSFLVYLELNRSRLDWN